jgi:hypothetical protein
LRLENRQQRERSDGVRREAKRFRFRLGLLLAGRGALAGAVAGAWGAGLLLLAGRLAGDHGSSAARLLFLLGIIGLSALIAAALATRRAPAASACLAALDAASVAGGLVMCNSMNGAEAWPTAVSRLPAVGWHGRRAAGSLTLALLFCLPTALLPERFFTGLVPAPSPTVESLVEQVAARVAQAETEALLPEPVIAALSNQLARIGESGDAADPARTLEALDHIAEELSRSSAAQAEALADEQAALQAAMALAEYAGSCFDEFAGSGAASAAARALAEYFKQAPLPAALSSNLLAACTGANGLNAASLARLASLLREAGASNEARLMRLSELKLVDASACRGGSCTNGQACAAALARLLEENDPAADAAACLAALCGMPGAGGVSRGRGDAPLTWTDPTTREAVAFKEETLTPASLPAADQTRLEGVSAAAPDVPGHAAATTAGALGETAPPQGSAPQAPILPRHRETVARFFE